MTLADLDALNAARLLVGIALGVLAARFVVNLLDARRAMWERLMFAGILFLIVGTIMRFGELWDRPLQPSGLPTAAPACLLLVLAWWTRYRVPA